MDKIYRRATQRGGTEKKPKNEKNRRRNVIMNFRVSQTEKELIEKRLELSGLPKAEFFIQSCMYQAILVKGNIKTFDAIKMQIKKLNETLDKEVSLEKWEAEDRESLRMILEMLNKIYGKEDENGE
ncbi:plasmid mobilization protein [Frisingicoccus sp.]